MRLDIDFYRRFDAGQAVSNSELGDERSQWLWLDSDWRRWEHDEPWAWEEARRQRWAEDLYAQQIHRRLERARFLERMHSAK